MSEPEPQTAAQALKRDRAPGQANPAPGLTLLGLPPLGALTLGALAVCVASGVVLLAGFEPGRPLLSTLAFETGRPFGWFVRSLHAWSAHLSLVALVAHTVDHVARKSDRVTPPAAWAVLVASLPVVAYLMIGGRAMPADAEALGVAAVLHGILSKLPWIGTSAALVLAGGPGGDIHVLTTHHVATATLLLALITVFHIRKLAPDPQAAGTALGISGILALLVRPALVGSPPDGKLSGPWYMGGLRLALEHLPSWIAALATPAFVVAALAALPVASPRLAGKLRVALAVALVAYAVLCLAAVRA